MSDSAAGRWVTIDGTHVLIKDGKIVEGPASLKGKSATVHPEGHTPTTEPPPHAPAGGEKATYASYAGLPKKTSHRIALDQSLTEASIKIGEVRKRLSKELGVPESGAMGLTHNDILTHPEYRAAKKAYADLHEQSRELATLETKMKKVQKFMNKATASKAAMSQNFILPTEDSDSRAVPMALAGFSREIDGQPVEYRRKEICRAGRTVKDVAGNPFSITRERIDQWINNFQRQSENGTKVFIPTKHTEILSTDNRGFVVSMERDGDSLYAVEQLIGADAIKDAARNDQSVYIKSDLQDDQGNVYEGEYIQHVALTPAPQITGLNGFAKVAASRGADAEAVVLTIATTSEPERSFDMKPEISAKLREKLGVAKSVTDEQLMEQVAEKFLAPPDPAIVAMSKADADKLKADKEAAERERDEHKEKVVAMSRLNPKVDEDTAFLVGESILTKRDIAIKNGAVTPAVAKELDKLLMDGDKANVVAMSRLPGSAKPLAMRFWEALADNKPTAYGEKTGRQHAVAMSRAPEDKLPREGDKPSDEEAAKAGQEQGEKWKNDQLKARGLPVEAA